MKKPTLEELQGERFRACRDAVDISRVQCAAIVDVSHATIQNIEEGIKMSSLNKAVEAMGISPVYITTGKGNRWADGKSDADNGKRLRSMIGAGTQAAAPLNMYQTEIYRQQENHISTLNRMVSLMQWTLEQHGIKVPFLKAPDHEASYASAMRA